jgi:outer membrane protein
MMWMAAFSFFLNECEAKTLFECWTRALRYSLSLKQEDSEHLQADARRLGGLSPFLPHVTASFLYLRQEEIQNPLGAQFFPSEQKTSKLTLNQNVFRGLRDLHSYRARALEKEAAQLEREWKRAEVKLDVLNQFYEGLKLQTDLELLELQMHAQEERLEDSIRRKKSGQYRETDRLNIETQLVQLQAQKESIDLQLKLAQKKMRSLLSVDEDWKLEPYPLSFEEILQSLDALRATETVSDRVDQKAQVLRVRAAEYSVSSLKGQHAPSLDLSANYYFDRPGLYKDVKWDIQLGIQLPLFSGFQTHAEVQEAKAAAVVQSLKQEQERIQAMDLLQGAKDQLRSDLARYKIWTQTSDLAEQSWQAYRAEYKRGTTDSLEVMRSLASYFEARRSKEKVYLEVQQNWFRYQLLSGQTLGEDKS